MKNLLIALTLISSLSFFSSCRVNHMDVITPSSTITVEEMNFSNYNAIDVSNEFQVFVNFSDTEEKIEVEANEDLQDKIVIEKRGKTLEIRLKNNTSINGNHTLNVYITTEMINDFNLSGESKVKIEDHLIAYEVFVQLTGESIFTGDIDADRMDVSTTGESIVNVIGHIDELSISSTGGSTVESYGFVCNDLKVDLTGESKAYLTVMETLNITASGESTLHYKGAGVIESQSLSGAARVRKED